MRAEGSGTPQFNQDLASAEPVPGMPARNMHQFKYDEHHGTLSFHDRSLTDLWYSSMRGLDEAPSSVATFASAIAMSSQVILSAPRHYSCVRSGTEKIMCLSPKRGLPGEGQSRRAVAEERTTTETTKNGDKHMKTLNKYVGLDVHKKKKGVKP